MSQRYDHWMSWKMTVVTHRLRHCVRESVSDSGYGHDDISCMTYDIHVDILLECVFAVDHCMST